MQAYRNKRIHAVLNSLQFIEFHFMQNNCVFVCCIRAQYQDLIATTINEKDFIDDTFILILQTRMREEL